MTSVAASGWPRGADSFRDVVFAIDPAIPLPQAP
jgi:hypothetical protein